MKKRILPVFCLLVLCLGLLRPVCVVNASSLIPEVKTSLTLHYEKGGKVFDGLEVGIYRVAEARSDGTFKLIAPYDSYSINIYGVSSQEQWNQIALTISSYLTAGNVEPDRTEKTDRDGIVRFTDLKTGLYLVEEVLADRNDGTYLFNRFMVYLPTPNGNGTFNYDVQAKPKCTEFTPKSQYTVTKLWKDAGYSAQRPKEITVDIYKNDSLYETRTLSAENNWTYTWYVKGDKPATWTVVERPVPDTYKVSITQTDQKFTVTNTKLIPTETPKTGDSFALLPWLSAMCISGLLLLILGIYNRRRQ